MVIFALEGDLGSPNPYVRLPDWAAQRKVELIASTYRTQADRTWFSEHTFLAQIASPQALAGGLRLACRERAGSS